MAVRVKNAWFWVRGRKHRVESWLAYESHRQHLRLNRRLIDRAVMRTRIEHPKLTTISHLCDWSISNYGFHGWSTNKPRHVFVKGDPEYLKKFYLRYLPRLSDQAKYILITGSADRTVPRQVDLRYDSYIGTEIERIIIDISSDKRLIRWYAENLDIRHPKMTPIPLGYLEQDGEAILDSLYSEGPSSFDFENLKVLCAHRVRQGPQWSKRRLVSELAMGDWNEFVDYYEQIPSSKFFSTVRRYPFTICVTGGGLDPSPKAWVALMAGSIPIIEDNTVADAYRKLPVVIVPEWNKAVISPELLKRWFAKHRVAIEDVGQRREVLKRLGMKYWWEWMLSSTR